MKNFTKAIALCMALLLCLSFPVGVSAAEVADATIDFTQKGSLTIYKIDLTNAEKDGAWDSSYVSTGVYDQNVYDALIGATRDGDTDNTSDLGNSYPWNQLRYVHRKKWNHESNCLCSEPAG